MSIPLPPLPEPGTWDKRYRPDQLRARDKEILRYVLEVAARAAENWYAGGLEDEIARDIRALEFHHHE